MGRHPIMKHAYWCEGGDRFANVNIMGVIHSTAKETVRKGYLCLESEWAEIHFRNIKILELPGGRVTPEQTAPVVKQPSSLRVTS